MNCTTVDEHWISLLSSHLTEALNQNKNARRLLIVQPRIVADNHVVQQNVDVGGFVRVERRDEGVRVRDEVALGCNHLQNEAYLYDFGLTQDKI